MGLPQPSLQSPRLRLRRFLPSDAPAVQRLVSDRQVADTTLSIPHPYPDGGAESWIATHETGLAAGNEVVYALTTAASEVIGAIGLHLTQVHRRAELGYWVGLPFWNQGFATEAGHAILWYGFEVLALNRIQARHFLRNPASGRVMQKLGMQYEGRARQDVIRWGRFEDVEHYALLRETYAGPPWQVIAE